MKHLPPPTVGELEAEGKRIWLYCRDCYHEVEEFASVLGIPAHYSCPQVRKLAVCSKCGSRRIDVKGQICQEPLAVIRARTRSAGGNRTY